MSANPKSLDVHTDSPNLTKKIESRKSEEIVIGFISPIGSGLPNILKKFKSHLDSRGYEEVAFIKLSKLLEEYKNKKSIDSNGSIQYKRYRDLQESGRLLRKDYSNHSILAEYAANEIAIHRKKFEKDNPNIKKIAYLIDQIKRPEEVHLLRAIYRNNFYLVGVTRSMNDRNSTLISDGLTTSEANEIIEIDRNETDENGQKVDKSLHLSDFFINNSINKQSEVENQINRFLGLIHGEKDKTPTHDEQGMYAAYMAGLKSACLSRQVGASIAKQTGEIIATGCNDVPKFGGGLYHEGGISDSRCMSLEGAECHNDKHKKFISEKIELILKEYPSINPEISKKILEDIQKESRIGSLIEFSRAVHAEMDALLSIARIGGSGVKDATLYTTTFPCHNCARHIVAAGISRVVYIEPYEKSLAFALHSDSIEFDQKTNESPSKVNFVHFSGVAPHRFHFLFTFGGRKDSQGKFIQIRKRDEIKKIPEYLDSYKDFEKKTVEHFASTYQSSLDNTPANA